MKNARLKTLAHKRTVGKLFWGSILACCLLLGSKTVLRCPSNNNAKYPIVSTEAEFDAGEFCRTSAGLRELAPHRDKHYFKSQYGQDKWILENIINYLDIGNHGTFVEFGARDGVAHSNTYYFDKFHNYSGVLIEPVKSEYEELVVNRARPEVVTVNGVLCSKQHAGSSVDFVAMTGGLSGLGSTSMPVGRLQSLEREAISKNKTYSIETTRMECYDLNVLVSKAHLNRIAILSVDCEGCELDVLNSFDFCKVPVSVVLAERSGDCAYTSQLANFIIRKGFIPVNWASSDVIYVHKTILPYLPSLLTESNPYLFLSEEPKFSCQ